MAENTGTEILQQQQDDLLEVEDSMENRYLVFDVKDEYYSIEIRYITEIVEMMPVTVVPSIPDCIVGVINLRGAIIPIMDVRMRFGYETKEYDSRTCIVVLDNEEIALGLIVDSVQEVTEIDQETIAAPPTAGARTADYYVKGIAKWKNDLQLIIDVDKFFSLDDAGMLNAVN
ncbi:MAG TPA: chemotaxis protein CheW [Clostridiales bacterium]|nr:chemotaxis protein CheW [Clostridiales bacterium]